MIASSQQLRAARAWLGLSRAEVAHQAGVCEMTLGRAERGKPIGPDYQRAVVSVYHIAGFDFSSRETLHRKSPGAI